MVTGSVPEWMWQSPRMVSTLADVVRHNNDERERRARG